MLGQFLCQGAATACSRVYCVVNGDLAVFVVEPAVDVLATLFQNFLTKNDRFRRGVWKKVILWNSAFRANGGSSVVSEVEDARLDTKPPEIAG